MTQSFAPHCEWVAEISNNHNGNFDLAVRLFHAAKNAGADSVKLQCYTPDELVALRGNSLAPDPWGSQGWTMHSLYTKAMTPRAWFPKLFDLADELELPIFASVFGLDSLDFLESLDCPRYKIASLDNHQSDLIAACRATGKPLVISAQEYNSVWHDSEVDDTVLYCAPGYPQEAPSLPVGYTYGDIFHGLSYHGQNPAFGAHAARCGARMVEAHFQLREERSLLEANISLDQHRFAHMVSGGA